MLCAYQGSSDYPFTLGTPVLEVCFDLALSPRILVNHQGGTVGNTGAPGGWLFPLILIPLQI